MSQQEKKHACFHYQFHPVGQGLFASGCLYVSRRNQPKFLWVYDCGSSTHKTDAFWSPAVDALREFAAYKDIDLLTLSHFDNDHINGVTALLRKFKVDTLLLPYAPLWQRLLVALSQPDAGNEDVLSFAIDPVGYLNNRAPDRIRTIVLVEPGTGAAPSPEPVREVRTDEPWKIGARAERLQANDPRMIEFFTSNPNSNLQVEMLPSGGVAGVMGLWEFVPYNAPNPKVDADFVSSVELLRDNLLSAVPGQRDQALANLKAQYEARFRTSKEKNAISLFLYAGPVYPSWQQCKMNERDQNDIPAFPARLPCYYRVRSWAPGLTTKCSILYSGDSYLDSVARYDAIANYLGPDRMGRLGVFQVNHHGALGNWHPGLAGKLDPQFSIFSSRPSQGNTYHPHVKVWDEFLLHGRYQVDTEGHGSGGWMLAH